jgi:Fic family protein
MIQKIAIIMRAIGTISSRLHPESLPIFIRKNQIQSIYSSLAIENNPLTEGQVRDLVNGKPVIGFQKDITEVQNAIKVYDHIQSVDPYDLNDVLKTHQILMLSLVPDAGRYRKGSIGVFHDKQLIFMAPPAQRVASLMNDLWSYMKHSLDHILIRSCVFHYEFEFIHPFSDGNGRMGRFLQTCFLGKEEPLFYHLPIESMIKKYQQRYYDVIALSHQQASSNVFIEFMLDAIIETIHDVGRVPFYEYNDISHQALKLLTKMKDGVTYSTRDLLLLIGLKSRVSLKKHYIDPLIQAGLVNMTIPQTPTSRNQGYRKT